MTPRLTSAPTLAPVEAETSATITPTLAQTLHSDAATSDTLAGDHDAGDLDANADTAHQTLAGDHPSAQAWEALRDVTEADDVRYSGPHAELGRGGMGRVILAFDGHLKRLVAVKELLLDPAPGGSSDPRASIKRQRAEARFAREARITGFLEHPGVVPVHELGRRSDGVLYYTMKQVRGQTLRDALRRCDEDFADSPAQALQARLRLLGHFGRLCQAIAYAHSRGVIHRDIKPDNVMIGQFGETVVLDWGLAKHMGGGQGEHGGVGAAPDALAEASPLLGQVSTARTIEGVPIGTPAYMAPEQAEGRLDDIDARSDVWGLGAVLFEVLVGRPPFEGDSPLQVVMQVATQPVPAVASLQPHAPPELVAIVGKALQRDPRDRYPNAGALSAEVEAFLEGRLVGAYAYSGWELARRFFARHRALAWALGSSMVLALGFSVFLMLAWRATEVALQQAQDANEKAREEERHANRSARDAHKSLALAHAAVARQAITERRYLQASLHVAHALLESPFHPLGPHRDDALLDTAEGVAARAELMTLYSRSLSDVFLERALDIRAAGADRRLRSVSFIPRVGGEGVSLATGDVVGQVVLSDWVTGEPLANQPPPISSPVYHIQAPPSGDWLVYGGHYQPMIHAWSQRTGKPLASLPCEGGAEVIALSPDGRWLIGVGRDLRVWFTGGEAWPPPLRLEETASDETYLRIAASVAPSSQRFAVSDSLGHVSVYSLPDAPDGAGAGAATDLRALRLCDISADTDNVRGLAFYDDHNLLIGGTDGVARAWDVDACRLTDLRLPIGAPIRGFSLSADRQWLAALTAAEVQLWDLQRRALMESLQPDPRGAVDIAFSLRDRVLATAGVDHTVQLWRGRDVPSNRTLGHHTQRVTDLSLSPQGRVQLSVDASGALYLWRTDTEQPLPLPKLPADERVIGGHLFGEDVTSLWLITASADGGWHLRDGLGAARADLGAPSSLGVIRGSRLWAFSADGGSLALIDRTNSVALWALTAPTPTLRAHLLSALQVPDSVTLSADGHRLAAGDALGRVALWDTAPARAPSLSWVQGAHAEAVPALAFSPDGETLAAGSRDALVTLWRASSGQHLLTLSAHTARVITLAFSPDGAQLLSAAQDNTLTLWDPASGAPLRSLPTSATVAAARFVPGSDALLIAEGDRIQSISLSANIWDTPPQTLLDRAEADSGLSLEGFTMRPLKSPGTSTHRADTSPGEPATPSPSAPSSPLPDARAASTSSGRVLEITGTSQRKPAPFIDAEALDPLTLAPFSPPVLARTTADGVLRLALPPDRDRFALRLSRDGQNLYDLSPWLRAGSSGWELNWLSPALFLLMRFEDAPITTAGAVTFIGVAAHGPLARYGDADPVGCLLVTPSTPSARVLYADEAIRPRRVAPYTHTGSGIFVITDLPPNQPLTLTFADRAAPSAPLTTHALPPLPPNSVAFSVLSAPAIPCSVP
jgi:eukaryotic-like serine/threonine-protein kinase